KYELLWNAPAFYKNGKDSFIDKTFHKFLIKNGIVKRDDLGTEWFYFNGEPEKSKELFDLFRNEGFSALQNDEGKIDYKLRDEQEDAVLKAIDYFKKNEKGEFLWNAKPRFGKTLASYDLAMRLDATNVLIVTNRPAIANAWFDDYELFVDGYAFISTAESLKTRKAITREDYISQKPIKPQFTFLSLQDLKGSKYFGGNFDKLKWIADLEWDLLIIDEAHEAIETGRTKNAFDYVKRNHTLHLSGTPFKALANQKFPKEAIYNWTYLDEQRVKNIELLQIKDQQIETGAHTDLPDLKLFTYRISQMITKQVNEGIEIDNETRDFAFDLNEFFRVKDKKFVHEEAVKDFLSNLTTNKKYPFSTPELREELKHTFWFVGNRVDSVKAMEQLLKNDPIFSDFKVVVAAGNGQSFEEEENDVKGNETSYEKVKKAIRENEKTITLSCGQLTTGVTIKEWTAVLMLTDIKSPSLYMQAAFRAQNPYRELRNGELYMKNSAYLFDFAPTRVLEIYDQFANGLNPKAVKGEITEKERKANIHELLNFFPVISEDVNGEMVELDSEKVLTFPNALAASEIVNARFMSNLLFNESIKGVFNFPKEVEDILNKLPEEKNKRVQTTKETLDIDDARKIADDKIAKINENTEIILGEKIFRTNTERVVDNLLNNNSEKISSEELVETFNQVAEPLIAKYKEVYKATQAETDEGRRQIIEKVKIIAEEFNSSEIKDSAILKQKLIEILEYDFVQNKVAQKEEEKVEKVQKTKEDEIRDRLRSFTRTIPMFIMANSSKAEITIDNFDLEIDATDFEDLTSITKEEFHKLRDGFDYEENGVRKTFQGVFNNYRFNASIAEFKLKKDQLANYFTAEQDIFELIPNQKTNQIFTPKKVVQMMVNQLEEHDPSLFTRTDATFIDLYMKSGMYITEIVKKLFANTRKHYKSDNDCLKHILENQVYGLAPTPILQGITQSYIFGFDVENKISRKNFIQHDITPEAKEGNSKQKLQELLNLTENMKFDAVVGNPPYQESTDTNFAKPVYHNFIDSAINMTPKFVCMVHPARFLFNAGATPKEWNEKMLNDPHLSIVMYEPESQKLFSGVEIKGGICVTLWQKNKKGKGLQGLFIVQPELRTIVERIGNGGFNTIVSPRGETKLTISLDPKYPKDLRLAPNYFVRFPEIFRKNQDSVYNIKVIGLEEGNKRTERFVEARLINDLKLNKWKVFMPKAIGSGSFGEPMSELLIGEPKTCCTYTFLQVGSFTSKNEAINCLRYLKTKLTRALLGTLKITQNNSSDVWKNVPLQDFSENSDINWSKSIAEIDQQLYNKYQLSAEEITFIEENVQPMD
ncbi:MAG: hypothetical protein FJX80_08790, partial [Bacteroidetes bacterium]|nr:hypothetical protein [Bacteroidota bacterium]